MKLSHNFVVTSKADLEISDAYLYYEFKQSRLGERFLIQLDKCFESIDINPSTFRIQFDDFRQAKIDKFPYLVVYRIDNTDIIIEAVFNTHRNPNKKTK